jgi:hypothetical protein
MADGNGVHSATIAPDEAVIENEFLTAEEILGFDDIEVRELAIPEWNTRKVIIRALTGKQRDLYESSLRRINLATGQVTPNSENTRAKLVALCLVGPDRITPLFTVGQVEALGAKNAAALDRIFDVAASISGINKRDRKALEEAAKKG